MAVEGDGGGLDLSFTAMTDAAIEADERGVSIWRRLARGEEDFFGAVATAEREEVEEFGRVLAELLDFGIPQVDLASDLFAKLSDLLLNPTYVPGEPCLPTKPLLRDLLDIALGRATGEIGAEVWKMANTAQDFMLPAFGTAEGLDRAVQSILDDPITAALNLVLGQQGKIDCETDAALGVGFEVIETGIRRLKDSIAEALF